MEIQKVILHDALSSARKRGKIWAEQAQEAADTGLRAADTAFIGRAADTGLVEAAEATAVQEAVAE